MNYNLKKINFLCVAVMRAAVAVVLISSFGTGYARSTAPAPSTPPVQYFQNIARTAGEGESEIVVYNNAKLSIYSVTGFFVDVFIDNQKRLSLNDREYGTVVVPNGTHSIYLEVHDGFRKGLRSSILTVDVEENRIVLMQKIMQKKVRSGGSPYVVDLVKYVDISLKSYPVPSPPLDIPKKPPSNNNNNAQPPKPVIASSDKDLPKIAVYVTGNVADGEKDALGTRMLASLINSGRYIAIERSNAFLAEIEKEHIIQRSGAVDDSQISELGKQFGVKFICIAAITPAFGEFQVSARIVDVETAQVVFIGESASPLKSMADLTRVSNQIVKNMFVGDSKK
jgi:hypothetical protein